MSNYKAREKAKAKHFYLTTNLSQKEIAQAVSVTEQCMSRWVRKENWAAQKQATYYSPEQVINQLYEELRIIDDNINSSPGGRRTANDEEFAQRNKLMTLINGHSKNIGANWRNVPPEYEYKNENIVDLNALSALERKNLEKRKKIAEEDANTSYGRRFSEEELEEYYTKVALQLALADSTREWEEESEKKSGSGEKDESGRAEDEDDEGVWEPLG